MSSDLSRRGFIGIGMAAGAAAAMSACNSAADAEEPAETVVLGVMGLSRGKAVAQVFAKQPGVDIRYVCDVDSKRAEDCAAELEKITGKRPQAIGDFRRILDDAGVQGLICAAPNHWHGPATILACQAGKHVYVEKPCCHNPREGEVMAEAAAKYHRAVQVGTQRRSSPSIRDAIEQLHSGAIGKVYSARATYAADRKSIGTGKPSTPPPHLDYKLWQGPAPETPYMDNVIHYNWHWFWHWGNGELGNNGVHALDICRWGLGVNYPTRVNSSGGRYCYADDQQTPDTHTVAYEFDGGKMVTWQGHSCNLHGEDHFVSFYGDSGAMHIAGNGDYTIWDAKNKVVKEQKGTLGEPEHAANFLAAIRGAAPAELNCGIEDAVKSTLLSHLGNIAHRTGRALQCDATNGHIKGDEDAMKLWSREYAPEWDLST